MGVQEYGCDYFLKYFLFKKVLKNIFNIGISK